MRFLANENFPVLSINILRQQGHIVIAVIEEARGAKDSHILAWAAKEQSIVLTFDRDYGELIYRLGLPSPPGIIYFRFDPSTPVEPAERLESLLSLQNLTFENKFTVVERGQLRQRPLPSLD